MSLFLFFCFFGPTCLFITYLRLSSIASQRDGDGDDRLLIAFTLRFQWDGVVWLSSGSLV